ncbi:hypothetical protein BN1864_LIB5394:02954 [Pseudomonas sp. 1 R 17]|nr:hypothetical protein BN1864_LIB5394:02954 [Pseudomonas sp. 1 R 17]
MAGNLQKSDVFVFEVMAKCYFELYLMVAMWTRYR